jgi:pSer/pThr/pTyr-binding forkhead associated (FHA) protein
MLELVYEAEGRPHRYRLSGTEISLGRSSENEIVLNDFSVSRKHAILRRENDRWVVADQNSTNGIKVNGRFVTQSAITAGDVLTVGTFTLTVREELPSGPAKKAPGTESTSTFVRSIADFNRDFGLEHVAAVVEPSSGLSSSSRRFASQVARGKISRSWSRPRRYRRQAPRRDLSFAGPRVPPGRARRRGVPRPERPAQPARPSARPRSEH